MGTWSQSRNPHQIRSQRPRVLWGLETQMWPFPALLFWDWPHDICLEIASWVSWNNWHLMRTLNEQWDFQRERWNGGNSRQREQNKHRCRPKKFRQYLKNSWTQTPRDNKSNLFAIQVKVLIYLFHKYWLNTHAWCGRTAKDVSGSSNIGLN